MARFVEARHDGVEGTALLPTTAFRFMPGWTPVDPTEAVPSAAAGTVDQVLADVGDDPGRARTALLAEQANPKPRVTLVKRLTEIADQSPEA